VAKKNGGERSLRVLTIILSVFLGILIGVFLLFGALIGAVFSGGNLDDTVDGNIALIPIKGIIVGDDHREIFGERFASASEIVRQIEKASERAMIKGIILEINSPGGSAEASEEIANAVKVVDKPVVAYIREIGASGGYWVASSADKIYASRLSLTGSIGVIGSYVEYAGFMDNYNLTYNRLVSGKYKDAGSPFKELTPDERALIQGKLDLIYDIFVEEVAANRELSKSAVERLATGFVLLGDEAKEAGLIDEIGGKKEVIDYLEKTLDIEAKVSVYKQKYTFFDALSASMHENSFYVGQGLGHAMISYPKTESFEVWT